MSILQAHDLGLAPLYLLKGRPSQEQTVILWIWQEELAGKKWSLASVARNAGTTGGTAGKICKKLCGAELLIDNSYNKAESPYKISVSFVPSRLTTTTPAKKSKLLFSQWVWDGKNIWARHQGLVSPLAVFNALQGAVEAHGEDKVMQGLDKYARESDAQYNPTPKKYAEHCIDWMPRKKSAPVAGRSMKDEIGG